MNTYRIEEEARREETRKLKLEKHQLEAAIEKLKTEARTRRREKEKQEELNRQRQYNAKLQQELRNRLLQLKEQYKKQTETHSSGGKTSRSGVGQELTSLEQPITANPGSSRVPKVDTGETAQDDDPDYGLGPTGGPDLSEGEESSERIEHNLPGPNREFKKTQASQIQMGREEDQKSQQESKLPENCQDMRESSDEKVKAEILSVSADDRAWRLLTGRLTTAEVQFILGRFPQLNASNLF